MRDRDWYLKLLKRMPMEKAYQVISRNLKYPDYVHEAAVATAIFKEMYGKDYASPEEMLALSQAAKIKALEEENEKLRLAQKERAMGGQDEVGPEPEIASAPPPPPPPQDGPMSKEQFYKAHPELLGAKKKQEWEKYKADNGIEG